MSESPFSHQPATAVKLETYVTVKLFHWRHFQFN